MSDELEPSSEETPPTSSEVEPVAEVEPETPPAPVATPEPAASAAATPPARKEPDIDVDAEYQAIDSIISRQESGDLMPDEAEKLKLKHQRNITKATIEAARPAQQVAQQQKAAEQARQYWTTWGKTANADDVAQTLYGKAVGQAKAQELFKQVTDEIAANPRYAKSRGLNLESIIYDRWMDRLDAESKKKPAPRASAPQTRITGNSGTSASSQTSTKTVRQKLEDGEYDEELMNIK